jgi:hypothetical protein
VVLAAVGVARKAGVAVNRWLIAGGVLSAIAAALHLAIIVGGPDWYRLFGAGEAFAQAAAAGSPVPALVTFGIATVLAVWAAYAFSGAGLIPRLPLLRVGLVVIATIYLLRGLLLVPSLLQGDAFMIWSSVIVLVYGGAYAIGVWRGWPRLA